MSAENNTLTATSQMALDYLETGDGGEHSYGMDEKFSKKLPDGITSKLVYTDIVRIAWPSFVELILTQLTSMADLMMVGQLGPWALSAVGLTTQPKFLMMTMFTAMNVGATAMVARYKGAGNQAKANSILRQALLLTLVLSSISSIVGYIFSEPLIAFMGASDAETLAGGTIYLQIQFAGFVFMALTTTITAALRGVGDSRTAMVYNLTANVVNVIFNYLLIYGNFGFPNMGIAGASLATVIGQCVAFVLAFWSILKKDSGYLHLSFHDSFKPDWPVLGSIFKIGMPALLEQAIMRCGMIIYSKTVAGLGTIAFATHQVCINIQSLSFMNGNAFAVSATSLMGQSLGKKRPDMAQAYVSRTQRIGMMVSLIIAVILFFFGGNVVALYNDDPQIIETGSQIMKMMALIQPFQSSQFIIAGALRGAGDTKATAVITFLTVLLVRPAFAIFSIQVLNWGLYGAWVAMVLDQLLRTAFVFARFNSGRWKINGMKIKQ